MSNKEEALKREQELKKELVPSPNIGEKEVFTGFSAFFMIVLNQNPNKIGNGMAQILIDNKTGRSRLLIRNHKDLNSKLLNCYILHELKIISDVRYQFDGIDADKVNKETYMIHFLSEDTGKKFKNAYMQSYISNKRLLDKR